MTDTHPSNHRHEVTVSDHALIRWLERVHGIDLEGFRKKLAAELQPFVGAAYVKKDGFYYRFDGSVLVTVTPKRQPSHRRYAKKSQSRKKV